jgi:hypothetical protein
MVHPRNDGAAIDSVPNVVAASHTLSRKASAAAAIGMRLECQIVKTRSYGRFSEGLLGCCKIHGGCHALT